MKKIFLILSLVVSLGSCIKDGEFTDTRPVYVTFEYAAMDYPKVFGADSLFFESEQGYGVGWQYMAFLHKVDTVNWNFEGGFALSHLKGSSFDPTDSLSLAQSDSLMFARDRFRVNVPTSQMSGTYAVFYGNPDETKMPAHEMEFLAVKYGTCSPLVCFVNNTKYVAYKIANTFEEGDRLTLKATGYLNGIKTGEESIALAEFTAKKDSIVSTWTKFDLSGLASVDFVDFEVVSTREEVPAYFCMDDFVASVTVSY